MQPEQDVINTFEAGIHHVIGRWKHFNDELFDYDKQVSRGMFCGELENPKWKRKYSLTRRV